MISAGLKSGAQGLLLTPPRQLSPFWEGKVLIDTSLILTYSYLARFTDQRQCCCHLAGTAISCTDIWLATCHDSIAPAQRRQNYACVYEMPWRQICTSLIVEDTHKAEYLCKATCQCQLKDDTSSSQIWALPTHAVSTNLIDKAEWHAGDPDSHCQGDIAEILSSDWSGKLGQFVVSQNLAKIKSLTQASSLIHLLWDLFALQWGPAFSSNPSPYMLLFLLWCQTLW